MRAQYIKTNKSVRHNQFLGIAMSFFRSKACVMNEAAPLPNFHNSQHSAKTFFNSSDGQNFRCHLLGYYGGHADNSQQCYLCDTRTKNTCAYCDVHLCHVMKSKNKHSPFFGAVIKDDEHVSCYQIWHDKIKGKLLYPPA